ncbi:MAG TPA: hypothetical protein VMH87_06330, partial [Pseudomonadales bacterium]|nr:hypothetical protein [Pseudomonadales bacterium]
MAEKRKFLTQAEFEEINHSSDWRIVELPLNIVKKTPGIQRKADLLGAFVSGDATNTKALNGQAAILGMDIIVYENRPKETRGEWNVNVYHYVVRRTGRVDFPYCLHGP